MMTVEEVKTELNNTFLGASTFKSDAFENGEAIWYERSESFKINGGRKEIKKRHPMHLKLD